VTIYIVLPRTY